ncbi:MAG: hypothetical protein JWQ54_4950 [Mucilaginibacter sp.]|nr:hypothetical protein [Mucilaginibacter sp.]
MEPTIKTAINLTEEKFPGGSKPTVHNRYLAFIKRQQKNQTAWFMLTMVLQGILILPVPAILLFYYDAPIYVLIITMLTYFPNIITAMTGSGLRVTLAIFACSLLINWGMLLCYIL